MSSYIFGINMGIGIGIDRNTNTDVDTCIDTDRQCTPKQLPISVRRTVYLRYLILSPVQYSRRYDRRPQVIRLQWVGALDVHGLHVVRRDWGALHPTTPR